MISDVITTVVEIKVYDLLHRDPVELRREFGEGVYREALKKLPRESWAGHLTDSEEATTEGATA